MLQSLIGIVLDCLIMLLILPFYVVWGLGACGVWAARALVSRAASQPARVRRYMRGEMLDVGALDARAATRGELATVEIEQAGRLAALEERMEAVEAREAAREALRAVPPMPMAPAMFPPPAMPDAAWPFWASEANIALTGGLTNVSPDTLTQP